TLHEMNGSSYDHDTYPNGWLCTVVHFVHVWHETEDTVAIVQPPLGRPYETRCWAWLAGDGSDSGDSGRAGRGLVGAGREHRGGRQHRRHQLRVDAGRRVPRDVHAGRLRHGGDRV